MPEAAHSPPGAGGGISNLDTFCSKSQAHFSNLLSLTQIQNNTRIKNNNNNKKAQLPRQSTPAHTYLSPEDRARERAAHGRGEPRCLVHGWEAVRGQEEDPEGRSHPVPGAEANKAPCAHSLLHRSAKGAIRHDRGRAVRWWSPFATSPQVSQASDHSTMLCNVLFLFGLGPSTLLLLSQKGMCVSGRQLAHS